MSSAGGCGLRNVTISISCWSKMFRRGRFERQVLGVLGRASLAARLCSITSLGRDRPRRFILPITALRVTPISRAVWPHERPAWRQRFSSSMRSEVQVAHFADTLMALLGGWWLQFWRLRQCCKVMVNNLLTTKRAPGAGAGAPAPERRLQRKRTIGPTCGPLGPGEAPLRADCLRAAAFARRE